MSEDRHMDEARQVAHSWLRDDRVPLGVKMMTHNVDALCEVIAAALASAEQRGMERARLSAAIQSYRDALEARKGE